MGSPGSGTQIAVQVPIKVKYVLYARKSSESEEKQVLSIDSQVKEMLQIAEREGLEVADIRRESHSAKDSNQRPVFNEIVNDLKAARFNGILTWAPDRLSRNAGDLGALVDLMDQKSLVEIKTFGQGFKNSPSDKFLLMILCSQAKLENDNKSVNVKRGLRTRVEMGLWPGQAPTGNQLAAFRLLAKNLNAVDSSTEIDFINGDVFSNPRPAQFNAVLMNPPFLRNDDPENPIPDSRKQAMIKALKSANGGKTIVEEAKQPNLYFYFMDWIGHYLKERGRAGVILMEKFLSNQDGEHLKRAIENDVDAIIS